MSALAQAQASVAQAEASLAILGIAEKLLQGRQTQANAAKVAGPLEKVVEAAATPELVNRAKALLKRAPGRDQRAASHCRFNDQDALA